MLKKDRFCGDAIYISNFENFVVASVILGAIWMTVQLAYCKPLLFTYLNNIIENEV